MSIESNNELAKAVLEENERYRNMFTVEDEVLKIRVDGHEYDICLRKVKTLTDLLEWVDQLGDKTWMSKEDLLAFIHKIREVKRW